MGPGEISFAALSDAQAGDSILFRGSAGDGVITDFALPGDFLVLTAEQTIASLRETDHDNDGTIDTIVELSSGDTITLERVSGVYETDLMIVAEVGGNETTYYSTGYAEDHAPATEVELLGSSAAGNSAMPASEDSLTA